MSNKPTITFPNAAEIRLNTAGVAEEIRQADINEIARRVVSAICAASGCGEFCTTLAASGTRTSQGMAAVDEIATRLRAQGFEVSVDKLSLGWELYISWEKQ